MVCKPCGEIINVNFLPFNLSYCDASSTALIKSVEPPAPNKNAFCWRYAYLMQLQD